MKTIPLSELSRRMPELDRDLFEQKETIIIVNGEGTRIGSIRVEPLSLVQCGNPDCSCMDEEPEPERPNRWAVLAVLVVLVLSIIGMGRACAQEAMPGPHGEPGVWLPLELSRDVLSAYEEGPRLHERIRLLERSLELREAAGLELRAALTAAESEAHQARGALSLVRGARDAAIRRARRRLGLAVGGSGLGLVLGLLMGFLGGG